MYANGIRNIDLQFIIRKLAAPVISVLLLALCVPYVIAAGVVPAVGGFTRRTRAYRPQISGTQKIFFLKKNVL